MDASVKGTICVIEKDDDVRASIRLLLETMEFSVRDFTDAESVPPAKELSADCLILDDRLPGMSGMDFLELLREEGIETPVIIVAAEVKHLAARAERVGVVAMLRKPLAVESLIRCLDHIFSDKQPVASK